MLNRFTALGVAALLAATAVVSFMATRTADVAFAGNNCFTATPSVAATPTVGVSGVQQGAAVAVCTPTSVVVHTATPTTTATSAATATSVPATEAPATQVPTQIPATSTPLGGGVGGSVSGPNTGTGPSGSRATPWLAGIAVALFALGGGALAYGARRRS